MFTSMNHEPEHLVTHHFVIFQEYQLPDLARKNAPISPLSPEPDRTSLSPSLNETARALAHLSRAFDASTQHEPNHTG